MVNPQPPASQDKQKLAVLHHHPRDDLICFDDPSHKYYININGHWKMVEVSATGKIGQFMGKFDKTKQIKSMRDGASFEHRFKTYKQEQKTDGTIDVEILALEARNELRGIDQCAESIRQEAIDNLDKAAAKRLDKTVKSSTWARTKRKYPTLTADEIDAKITDEWDNSNVLGSKFHLAVEHYFNDIDPDPTILDTPEWKQFLEYKNIMTGDPYRTEWTIWGRFNDKLFSGMIDFVKVVGTDGDTLLVSIIDWKRSKRINTSGKKECTGPFAGLIDNNYTKYALQLSLYAYILETVYKDFQYKNAVYPNIKVVSRELVVCHPNNVRKKSTTTVMFGIEYTPPVYKHYLMPDYTDRIKVMLENL